MSEKTTEGIRVRVESHYIESQSRPERNQFLFAYRVKILNLGTRPAKLLSRHWIIEDGMGKVEEVRGPGVIGLQPRLEPGEEFEYTSACPLPTPVGSMRGSYQMVRDDGELFRVAIAPFSLEVPYVWN